jgi:hypothetical protein
MLHWIVFITALLGSTLAAAWDLKTTEIPDEISYVMVIVAVLVHGYVSLTTGTLDPIIRSVAVGVILFGFGYVLYYFGQWGGGDVKLLAALGALIPTRSILATIQSSYLIFPWPISYVFNVFFVGAIYMMVYAFVMALTYRKTFIRFKKELIDSKNIIIFGSIGLFLILMVLNWMMFKNFETMRLFASTFVGEQMAASVVIASLVPLALTIVMFVLWKFIRAVEAVAFKRRIPVGELRVGDVLEESKLWEGITEKELRQIKRSKKKFVRIKEGVRFAPAFPLALLFTIYFGDAILLLLRLNI